MASGAVVTFPPFRLDIDNAQLWEGKKLIPLRPKPFAMLRYFAQHPNQLVTKEEIGTAIWEPTEIVEREMLINTYIRDLRKVLKDDPEKPQFIETVVRRGYRFIASVQNEEQQATKVSLTVPPPGVNENRLPTGFVGRERELEQLQRWYEKTLLGERQVVFVTGEAGIGKSTLVEAFLQRIAGDGRSRVERGQCVEQYGQGEAYLPVLEALGRSCRRSGGDRLIEIMRQYAPTWLVQMPALVPDAEFEVLQRKVHGATRERMLREMAEALEVMTTKTCSVVVLEDLQWSDHATLDLLSYVAQRREPAQLLVIGTYRPTDVIVSNHPIKGIKQDLQGRRLCTELALSLLPEAAVGHYLDERFAHHQFPNEFAQTFYRSTDGNPLFMVNVADYIEGQGLVGTVEGQWQLKATLREVTTGIPDSLRQMIERQIDRLSAEARDMLEAGSAVGADFSSTAVAAAIGSGEAIEQIEERCEVLAQRGHFLRANGTTTLPDGTITERYGFLHALYQQVLYSRLSASRQRRLHRRIGDYLEAVYGNRAGEIATELANHFELGQDYQRAVQYLYQAANNAIRRSAHLEAVTLLKKGLALLSAFPDTADRRQQELALQIPLAISLTNTRGYAIPEVESAYVRARELCQQLGENLQLFSALFGIAVFYFARGQIRMARELSEEQLLSLAQRAGDPSLLLEAHVILGFTLVHGGEILSAREHLEQGIEIYDPQYHGSHAFLYGQDPGVGSRCQVAWALWMLGYPDQALKRSEEALTLARQLAHPWSLALALHYAVITHQYRREGQSAKRIVEELIRFSHEQGFPFWLAMATITHGFELVRQGTTKEGIQQIHQGLAAHRALGADIGSTYWLALLAEGYLNTSQIEEGLDALAEALTITEENGERIWESEVYRFQGELLLKQGEKIRSAKSKTRLISEAEKCFQHAFDLARRQSAKSYELRAAMSLSRLWQQQGKKEEAHKLLSDIYGWFTEGFDTKDLQEAKALLESLESGV